MRHMRYSQQCEGVNSDQHTMTEAYFTLWISRRKSGATNKKTQASKRVPHHTLT